MRPRIIREFRKNPPANGTLGLAYQDGLAGNPPACERGRVAFDAYTAGCLNQKFGADGEYICAPGCEMEPIKPMSRWLASDGVSNWELDVDLNKPKTVVEALREAVRLLSTPALVCPDTEARDLYGRVCDPCDPGADKWGGLGALARVCLWVPEGGVTDLYYNAEAELLQDGNVLAVEEGFDHFNDGFISTGNDFVLRAIGRTLERLGEEDMR